MLKTLEIIQNNSEKNKTKKTFFFKLNQSRKKIQLKIQKSKNSQGISESIKAMIGPAPQ